MSELERYLSAQKSLGNRDSQGFFTLDQGRALAKIREYQLASPHEFILKLVASAVAAGATYFHIEQSRTRLLIERDGRALTFDELSNIFSAVLVSQANPEVAAVRELAVGLNGALHFRPRWVQVISSCEQGSVRLRLDGNQLTVERFQEATHQREFQGFGLEEDSVDRTYFELEGMQRSPLELLKGVVQGAGEIVALRQRAALCGLKVKLNGAPLDLTPDLGAPLIVTRSGKPGVRLPKVRVKAPVLSSTFDFPEADYCWLALQPGPASRVEVVLHGVVYPARLKYACFGLQAIVSVPGLLTDLSGSAVVENAAFEAVLETLSRQIDGLVTRLTAGLERLALEPRLEATDLLDHYAINCVENGQSERAEAIFKRLRAVRTGALTGRYDMAERFARWSRHYRDRGVDIEASYYYRGL